MVCLFFNGTGTVRYVGTLFELKIPDFSHIAPDFCMQRQKTAKKPTLNVWIEIADS